MSRVWRRLGWLLLGLVVLLALGLVVEHWRGRRILAATVADLQARGRMPDPKVLFAPPGPSNGFSRFLAAVGTLGSAYPPPSMQGVAPGRAAESFRFSSWEGRSGQIETWDTLAAWGRTNAAGLDQIRHALAQPECRPALDWRRGFQLVLSHLSRQKSAAVALAADALLAAQEEDKEGVLANFEALQALEQALAREPLLISQLVRVACSAISSIRAWDVAQRDDWSEADLAALQAALPAADLADGMVRALEGELILWVQMMCQLRAADFRSLTAVGFVGLDDDLFLPLSLNETGTVLELIVQNFAEILKEYVFFPLWLFAWRDQSEAYHLRTMAALIAHSREQAQRQDASLPPPREADIGKLRSSASWLDRARYWPTYLTLPAMEKTMRHVLRSQTERALIETGIALRRHQLRHGRLPERLDELVPEFLAAVPKDGMDGQPLRYRLNANGTYTLWSVGEDFVDHGGDPSPAKPNPTTLNWRYARDAVLPRRADDEEFAAWEEAETARRLKRQARTAAGSTNMHPVLEELARRDNLPLPATNAAAPAPPP